MRLLILIICGLLPGILSQCTVQRAQRMLKRSVYDFAIELSMRIAVEKDNHFVAATLSPWTLLAIAAQGATDRTLDELQHVLRLNRQQCFNDRFFELIRTVVSDGPNATLERSATIFVDESLPVKDEFRRRVADAGVAGIESLSFLDPETAASSINDYVNRATHDTIDEIVVPSDLDRVYLVMVDAIFFKGLWASPFPDEDTTIEPFYNDRGSQIGEVNMMAVSGSFKISWITQIQSKVIELPFGKGRYVMLVFLPFEDSNLSRLIDSLKTVSLTSIYSTFERDGGRSQVMLQLPRFRIASDHNNLKELLSDMGLQSAFDENRAQFSDISDFSLFITNFVQKANIEVTEKGSEASASTAALFAARASLENFVANVPFFYMIVDTQNKLPIFTGAYSKPSVY